MSVCFEGRIACMKLLTTLRLLYSLFENFLLLFLFNSTIYIFLTLKCIQAIFLFLPFSVFVSHLYSLNEYTQGW